MEWRPAREKEAMGSIPSVPHVHCMLEISLLLYLGCKHVGRAHDVARAPRHVRLAPAPTNFLGLLSWGDMPARWAYLKAIGP